METSVADAIAALRDGDAEPLALVLAQQKIHHRKRGGDKKRGKKKAAASEEQADEAAGADIGEEVRALPSTALDEFYPAVMDILAHDDAGEDDDEDSKVQLKRLESVAEFTMILVETKDVAIDKEQVFAIAQELHDRLLRLHGDADQVQNTQEAIALLCEACWKNNFYGMAHSLVTQLLPYLIVRAYESPSAGNFKAKRHPVRRLYAIKDALLLLDFDDESSGCVSILLLDGMS